MFKRIISQKYFCGVDIGEVSVKAALVRDLGQQPPELLGVYENSLSGFNNGAIANLHEFSECLHLTVSGLLGRAGVKLKDIQVGVGARAIDKHYSSAVIPLLERGSKVISRTDVQKVKEQARVLGATMDERVLHNLVQYFKVDDVNTALNPLGLYGRKLEVKSLLILIKNALAQNLVRAVNQAGYDVSHMFYTAYSSAQASLSEYHRRQGCAVVDVGTFVTEILIFQEGYLKYVVHIPIGGDQFTQSIAHRLGIQYELAEEIKRSYAFAISQDSRQDEEILIKKEDGYAPIKKELIAQSLEPTVVRFVEMVLQAMNLSHLSNELKAGIVMSGGGALLPGLEERVEAAAGIPVKMGQLTMTAKRLAHSPKYFGAIGLALSGLAESRGAVNPQESQPTIKQKFSDKLTELYQEYF